MEFPELRLSDDERQEALDALTEHVRTGRLEIDEYGERSAQVTAARRRGDLEKLFADLPQPRPSVLDGPSDPPARERTPEPREKWPMRRTAASLALPIAAIIAIVLILTVAKTLAVFLIPIAVAVIGPSLFARRRR